MPVGNIYGYQLHSSHATFLAQIHKPYQALLRDNGVFWDRSGIDIDLGLLGFSVSTSPLSSFLNGRISLATPEKLGIEIDDGALCELSDDHDKDCLKWQPMIEMPPIIISNEPEEEKL